MPRTDAERNALALENVALGYHMLGRLNRSSKYRFSMGGSDDVLQEIMIGLLSAAGAWDSTVASFSTFACRCILNRLARHGWSGAVITVPCAVMGGLAKTRAGKPTNVPPELLDAGKKAAQTTSLVMDRGHVAGVATQPVYWPESALDHADWHDELRASIDTLPRREAALVKLRYGFDGPAHTLEACRVPMGGISKERVRQLESRALERLRGRLERKGWN